MSIAVYYKKPEGLSGMCRDTLDVFILHYKGRFPWLRY